MRLPNLKHLHYFNVLYQEQHFARAAQKCNVSQSTLSAAIQNLEDYVGEQLLEREHKTFVFTAFAQDLVERSQTLLAQAQEWQSFAQSAGDWQSGELKIGVIPTIAPFVFELLISNVNQQLPHITLALVEDTTDHLLEKLAAGEVDLLLLALPMKTPGCAQLKIARDRFHLIAHKNTAAKLPENVEIEQLPERSIFLLEKEHCLTEHAVSACDLAYKSQVSPYTATSLQTLVSLVNSQQGFTFMPSMALNSGILSGTQVETVTFKKDAFRDIGLVWRKGTTRVQLFRRVGDLIGTLIEALNNEK